MKTKILTTLALVICTMAFAQSESKSDKTLLHSTKNEAKVAVIQIDSVYYTCPIHPDVKLDKPGKCPKCEMPLKKKTIQKESDYYTCRMHPEVKSDKPGNCPKCDMPLEKKPYTKKRSSKNLNL